MLRNKLAQAEKLISVVVDINANEPVFRRTPQAFKDGNTVENTSIESIEDMGNSVWSRVIQVIVKLGTDTRSFIRPINLHQKTTR